MKKWTLIILAVLFLALWIYPSVSCFAKTEESTEHLSRKLKTVIENQEKILSKLAEIQAELKIVKVRATLR